MKLIIQIPCLNEEDSLPVTLKHLPRQIEGISQVEILVINDGSTDRTEEVAREQGVQHIVKFSRRQGLARAFQAGLDACLKLGADIIVNTDADNQYQGEDIVQLIQPVLSGDAQMVVGCRDIENIPHFSKTKKRLQRVGSWVVRHLSETDVPDTTSGFRAYSREAALKLNVISDFTYTLDTIIQAGSRSISIEHVPVHTNEKLRESRLFSGIGEYLKRSLLALIRIYTMYRPLRVFTYVGSTFIFIGLLITVRFLITLIINPTVSRHVQSLIFAGVFFIIGFQVVIIGLLSDIIAANRRLLEDILYRVKKMELILPSIKKNKRNP